MKKLTITDHSRVFKDFVYIYPVLSRRSQGVSLGINLNINNACNWRCVYCQVEGLIRGKPTTIDLTILEAELDKMFDQIVNKDFLEVFAPTGMQRFNDVAISGNGEPTLSKEFLAVVAIISKLRVKYGLNTKLVKTVLITNGSEIDKPDVLAGLDLLSLNCGEVWFKIDRATVDGISKANQVNLSLDGIQQKLILSAKHCKTYIQTCMFATSTDTSSPQGKGVTPSQFEVNEYIKFVLEVKNHIAGVLLYSVARNPALPEGKNISQVSEDFLHTIAERLRASGVEVQYYL